MDFGIGHSTLGAYFLVLLAVCKVDGLLGLLDALLAEVVIGIEFESCLVGRQGLVVLLEEVVAVSFLVVGLQEVGVLLESYLIVFLGALELHQLDVDLPDITVELGIVGVSSDCLLVFLECLWEFA